MRIFIKAKPNSKKELVKKIDENNFIVSVKEAPIKGRANQAIIKTLADYFNVSPLKIRIVSGHRSRQKVIEVL